MSKTVLYNEHIKLGGKIVEFAGWEMPVQYEGILAEHEAVRTNAGLFDVSHMGEVNVTGSQAFEFVQNLVTNDISVLSDNQGIYTLMCYPDGGVVDDLLVYKIDKYHYYLVINAGNIDKDFKWMVENINNYMVELVNVSNKVSEVALQGPKAEEVLQKLVDTDLSQIKFFYFSENISLNGVKCMISRTGYTGEDGFEIYADNQDIEKIWNNILEIGKDYGVKPCGLGCRDTLRFEVALPLYGNEISENITPLEAGLGYFVKLDAADFIGKSALAEQKKAGLTRKTIGFEMVERAVPRHGYKVMCDTKEIGFVTTGNFSPTLKKNLGIAIVEAAYAELGKEIQIVVRNKPMKAIVVSKKFYTKNYKK